MKDYSAMSDFDIQQAVLQETWGRHPVRLLGKMMLDIMLSDFDPCNKPADAWPIIVDNAISIVCAPGISWLASSDADFVDGVEWQIDGVVNSNPLRAAMIAFLMMKDAEKGHG